MSSRRPLASTRRALAMASCVTLLVVFFLLAGCQATTPTFEPATPPTDLVRLSNGQIYLDTSPQLGRITGFGLVGQDSLLWMNPVHNGFKGYVNHGGDKVWPAVQSLWPRMFDRVKNWPPDGIIDGQAWEVLSQDDRSLVIRSRPQPQIGARVTRRIKMHADQPSVTITNTLEKAGPGAFPLCIWTVTQVETPESAGLQTTHAMHHATPWDDLLDEPERDPTDQITVVGDEVHWDMSNLGVSKVGTFGREVWARYPDVTFIQVTTLDPDAAYPDGSNLQVFTCPDYIELETLSPTRHLAEGEQIEHVVTWTLKEHTRESPVHAGR